MFSEFCAIYPIILFTILVFCDILIVVHCSLGFAIANGAAILPA